MNRNDGLQKFRADGTGVPTVELRETLTPAFLEMGAVYGESTEADGGEFQGVIELVSERAARYYNIGGKHIGRPAIRVSSMYRRISAIFAVESEVTDLATADALLLACDRMLGLTDLPVLPGSLEGAEKLVDAWIETHPEDLGERDNLIRTLISFHTGYLNGPLVFEDPEALERRDKRLALQEKKRQRNARAQRVA